MQIFFLNRFYYTPLGDGGIIVKLFGQIVDIVGSDTLEISSAANVEELVQKLQSEYPALATSKYRIAVNRNIIQSNINLQTGAEVALLPPFSGG